MAQECQGTVGTPKPPFFKTEAWEASIDDVICRGSLLRAQLSRYFVLCSVFLCQVRATWLICFFQVPIQTDASV